MSVLNKFLTAIAVILAFCFIGVSFLTLYERHQMKIEIVEQAKEKGTEILENIGIPTTPIPPVAPIEPDHDPKPEPSETPEAEAEPSPDPSVEPSAEPSAEPTPENQTEDNDTEETDAQTEETEENDQTELSISEPYENNVTYRNDGVVDIEIREGMTMSVGVDGPSLVDAIYLNPTFQNENRKNDRYAFYISTEYGRIDCSHAHRGTADSKPYLEYQSFAIMDRTYDTLVPAEFKTIEDYGVRWVMDKPITELEEMQGSIYIRAVSLDTGMMIGTAEVRVAYLKSANAFEIASGYSSDIMHSPSYTEADREELLDDAVTFFVNGTDEFTIGFNDPKSLEPMLEFASVEEVTHPYFSKLYTDKSIAFRNNTLDGYTLIAVNIPHKDFGVLTAYFIPWEEAGKVKTKEPVIEEDVYNDEEGEYNKEIKEPKQDDFTLIGYDALMPFSQSTFIDNLYPDDIEFFTGSNLNANKAA